MMIYGVEAYSLSAPMTPGTLRYVGSGSTAINFLTADNNVLTIHRNGTGISPSGWVVDSTVFVRLSHSVDESTSMVLDEQGMILGRFRLNRGDNGVDLKLHQGQLPTLLGLTAVLAAQNRDTGLYGSLQHIVQGNDLTPFAYFMAQLETWYTGGMPQWDGIIGGGPGLTPSHDDMLIGMLFCAHRLASIPFGAKCLLPATLPLAKLTTSVSMGYLQQARDGYFSAPLLSLLLTPTSELTTSVAQFIGHGHFSGADTLLGIWLFMVFMDQKKTI
ncbi:DUF2877 domain-containing protein [Photobacterium nomapromontoriensis]|uniref:oxamate carbamoyltransferase subunit AllH family protein n=1 Tax=Photobacterium nomapromontoriensis TaxID=2910237 RepID=UPI003D0F88BF